MPPNGLPEFVPGLPLLVLLVTVASVGRYTNLAGDLDDSLLVELVGVKNDAIVANGEAMFVVDDVEDDSDDNGAEVDDADKDDDDKDDGVEVDCDLVAAFNSLAAFNNACAAAVIFVVVATPMDIPRR